MPENDIVGDILGSTPSVVVVSVISGVLLFCFLGAAIDYVSLSLFLSVSTNYSDVIFISAIVLWCEQRVWWYKKCMFGIWLWTFWLDFFVDTTKTLAHGECLTILGKSWKSYILKDEQINNFKFFDIYWFFLPRLT